MRGCEGARVRGCEGAKVRGCEGARACRAVVATPRRRMRGCEGAKVRGCEGAKVLKVRGRDPNGNSLPCEVNQHDIRVHARAIEDDLLFHQAVMSKVFRSPRSARRESCRVLPLSRSSSQKSREWMTGRNTSCFPSGRKRYAPWRKRTAGRSTGTPSGCTPSRVVCPATSGPEYTIRFPVGDQHRVRRRAGDESNGLLAIDRDFEQRRAGCVAAAGDDRRAVRGPGSRALAGRTQDVDGRRQGPSVRSFSGHDHEQPFALTPDDDRDAVTGGETPRPVPTAPRQRPSTLRRPVRPPPATDHRRFLALRDRTKIVPPNRGASARTVGTG